jgi:hypothetical protein
VALPVVAAVEALSLLVLLVNLATVHLPWLASLLGPVHGLAYAAGIALAFSGPYARRARWLSVVPGIGAALTVRSRREEPDTPGG